MVNRSQLKKEEEGESSILQQAWTWKRVKYFFNNI